MVKLTPKQAQEKHARRLKASVPDIILGIDRVTENPMQKAVAKADKMRHNWLAAFDSGKWAQNTADVTLPEWKEKFKTKGVNNISKGIDGAAAKVEKFYSQLFPHIEAGQNLIEGMPDFTIDDSVARQEKFTRHMHNMQFKR